MNKNEHLCLTMKTFYNDMKTLPDITSQKRQTMTSCKMENKTCCHKRAFIEVIRQIKKQKAAKANEKADDSSDHTVPMMRSIRGLRMKGLVPIMRKNVQS